MRAVDGVSYGSTAGGRWGSSASPAAARASPPNPCCGSCPGRGGSSAARSSTTASGDGGSQGSASRCTSSTPAAREIRAIRGNEIAYIFQEPMSALSPVHTIGHQITEMIRLHQNVGKEQARAHRGRHLRRVGLPRPEEVIDPLPPPARGGMRQRAVIGDGPGLPAEHADRRRADDRAGRDDRGADPGPAAGAAARLRDGDPDHHPQPGRGRRDGRRGGGDVPRQAGGAGAGGRDLRQPRHPYTRALLRSIPAWGSKPRGRLEAIQGMVPDPFSIPKGCAFHTRCPHYQPGVCDDPQWEEVGPGHWVRCSRSGLELDGVTRRPPSPHRRPATATNSTVSAPTPALDGRRNGAQDDLLVVREPAEVLPHPQGLPQPGGGAGAGRRRRELHRQGGRDAGPGRRERLRQDDHQPADHARLPAHGGGDPLPRPAAGLGQHPGPGQGRPAPRAAQHPDDLPGPLLLAQSRG